MSSPRGFFFLIGSLMAQRPRFETLSRRLSSKRLATEAVDDRYNNSTPKRRVPFSQKRPRHMGICAGARLNNTSCRPSVRDLGRMARMSDAKVCHLLRRDI